MTTCPLKMINTEYFGCDDCAEGNCAWYNNDEGACAVLDISRRLTAIYRMKQEE
ncbi:MAG: hypothetical protein KAQ85_00385 [Thermodesulfovibrionia bacterium]|nr:hypothetical protein [Thermodesulfovibrionia bacterium]